MCYIEIVNNFVMLVAKRRVSSELSASCIVVISKLPDLFSFAWLINVLVIGI